MTELYCILVILIAFVGEALFGFGGGLLAVPLLSLATDVSDAVMLTSIFQFLIGFLVFRNLQAIPWGLMPPVIAGLLIGVPVGVLSLNVFDPDMLRWILALFILAFLIRAKWFANLTVRRASTPVGVLSGALSGFFQGCIGTGGPNLVIYFAAIAGDRAQFRASLIFVLSLANLIRMLQMGAMNSFSPSVVHLGLLALPFFVVGIYLGQRYHEHIPEKLYYLCAYSLLGASAVALLWRNVGA